ncbi:hypothetical protein D1872_50520 [compost metagenome]
MYDYSRASDEYIKTTLDSDFYDSLYTPCFNLSCILCDVNGKMSTGMVTQVLTGLEIVSPGVLVLGETGEDIEDSILSDNPYAVETSQSAYEIYTLLKSSSEDVVIYLDSSSNLNPESHLLTLSETQTPTLRSALNTLYIEALALYRNLLKVTSDSLLKTPKEDLVRIANNARWISNRLEAQSIVPYDLVEVVRDLQITVFYVSSLEGLFEDNQSALMQKLYDLSDSVVDKRDKYTVSTYTVQAGDNIYSISQKSLGDAAKAIDIILFNDLEYPYVSTEPAPGVKTIGDSLQIPVFERETSVDRYLYLGRDLRIVDRSLGGGDLEADIYGDLQLVEGLDCLLQDLETRFSVEVGTLLFHPEYGNNLMSLVGKNNDTTMEQKVHLEATRVFNSESRISEVVSLSVVKESTAVSIRALLRIADSADPIEFSTRLERSSDR